MILHKITANILRAIWDIHYEMLNLLSAGKQIHNQQIGPKGSAII